MAKNEHQRPAHRNLLPAERQNEILNLLTNHNVVTIPELAQKLDTSDITIRRDLASLSKAGLLKRVRGGAMSVSSTTDSNDQQSFTAESDSIPSPISLPADQPSIGVMLPEPSFFWPNVINHMHEAAARYGMRLIVKESAYEEDVHEADILQDFADEPTVCGIIAAPNAHPEFGKQTWDWIERSSIPVVAVERDQPILGTCYTDSVRTNHRYGVRKAAVHFLQHGHSRIGAAFSETPTSHAIRDGWQEIVDATDKRNGPFVLTGMMPYVMHGVKEIADTIFSSGVTAVLVHSDYLAIAISQALEQRGKHVPEDISIISIDGFATPSSRPLTVLRSSAEDLAEVCIRTLVNRIQNPDQPTQHVFVDPILVDRGSVIDCRD